MQWSKVRSPQWVYIFLFFESKGLNIHLRKNTFIGFNGLKKCYHTEEQHSPPNTVEEDFGPAIIRTDPVPMDNTTIVPTPTTTTTSTTTGMRRSTRDKRPPDRYAPEVTH